VKSEPSAGGHGLVPSEQRRDPVELVLPEGRAFDAVGRLVAAGVAARSGLQLDRVERLQLALDAVRTRPGAQGETRMRFRPADGNVSVEVVVLAGSPAGRGLERVLSPLVDEIRLPSGDGDRGVVLRVANAPVEGP
jgi:hypothetical protein